MLKRIALTCLVIGGIGAACTAHAQSTGPKVSGYIKAAYQSDLEDYSETDVSNARVKFSGSVNEGTSYTVFIDGVRDDVVLDAFIKHAITPSLAVQIGQFKTAYSTENLTSNAKVAFVNRPYMKKEVSPAFRDRGVQVAYSNTYVDAFVGMMNGSGQNKSETNSNKSMAYRIVARVLPQLNISGNYYNGKNAADSIRDEFVNVGANGTVSAFEYAGEYARKDHGSLTATAMFAWVAYDFATGIGTVPTLTPAFRIESSDPDTDIDDNEKSRYTLGVTAHFAKKYTDRVMLNYEIRETATGDPNDLLSIEYVVIF